MEWSYACIECEQSFAIEPNRYLCDKCATLQSADRPLRGQLELRFSGKPPEAWERLRDAIADSDDAVRTNALNEAISRADPRLLLPVDLEHFPAIPVGGTPLWEPTRLRDALALPNLYLKDDSANPTGSLKDRASYLVAAYARQHGLNKIVVASTGNAGSSMAGVGAAADLSVKLYLPASAPQAKMIQALQYGADLIKVEGNYDQAFDESLADMVSHGGLSRNTAYNPLTVEGKKTAALEIFLQLGARTPDVVYVPTGDGVILSGIYKGFEDLHSFGLSSRIPELVSAQALGSAAITRALKLGDFGKPCAASTVADSISVDVPRGGYYALGRLQRHGGRCVTVSDEEILSAQYRLSSTSGLFAEPAAAAAFAALWADIKEERRLEKEACVVVLLTGSGLKDIPSALRRFEHEQG